MAIYLSVRQPHAHAIITGEKRIENRSWETRTRGWVWIHAGKSLEDLNDDNWENWRDFYQSLPAQENQLTFGAIIGGAYLVDCLPKATAKKTHPDQIDFIGGPYCFIFERPRILKEPVLWKGNTGFQRIALDPTDSMFVTGTT